MARTLAVFAASMALFIAPAAYAQHAARAISVRTADLDLGTDRGAAMLLRRIEGAADNVCGRDVAERYPRTRDNYEACRDATVAAAVAQVNAPALDAVYAQRYGDAQVAAR